MHPPPRWPGGSPRCPSPRWPGRCPRRPSPIWLGWHPRSLARRWTSRSPSLQLACGARPIRRHARQGRLRQHQCPCRPRCCGCLRCLRRPRCPSLARRKVILRPPLLRRQGLLRARVRHRHRPRLQFHLSRCVPCLSSNWRLGVAIDMRWLGWFGCHGRGYDAEGHAAQGREESRCCRFETV
jgi:hypothetical protein